MKYRQNTKHKCSSLIGRKPTIVIDEFADNEITDAIERQIDIRGSILKDESTL